MSGKTNPEVSFKEEQPKQSLFGIPLADVAAVYKQQPQDVPHIAQEIIAWLKKNGNTTFYQVKLTV